MGPFNYYGYAYVCVYTDNMKENQTGGKRQAGVYMYYGVSDGYNNYGWGDGEIPASALQITRTQATLSINPSAVPGFFVSGPFSGTISLTWKKNGFWSSRESGTYQGTSFDNRRIKSSGSGEYVSATTNGTFLGIPFATEGGSIGKAHDKTIIIER